jgi:predicted nucleic acid-binding protein
LAVGRGRPALVRGVYSFEDPTVPIPTDLALDTSFVIEALVKSQPLHAPAKAFMLRLVNDETVVYFNRLLEVEFAEVAFKLAVIEQHGRKGWPAKRNDGRVRRRAGRLSADLRRDWGDLLLTINHTRIELDEVADDVPQLMAQHGLASYDAAHAATAMYVSAGGLVTTDAGFGRVPEKDIALYVDNSRIRSCRRHRGGK